MGIRKSIILGIVLFAAPWAVLALIGPRGPTPTLVAIPSDGRDLSALVAETFRGAPYFVIADLKSSTARSIENPYWRDRDALGLKAAYLLVDQNVGAVLVKSIRPAVHNALYSRGVHIYDGDARTVLEAIGRFRAGKLADLGPAKLPHHIDASHIPVIAQPCPCLATPIQDTR